MQVCLTLQISENVSKALHGLMYSMQGHFLFLARLCMGLYSMQKTLAAQTS